MQVFIIQFLCALICKNGVTGDGCISDTIVKVELDLAKAHCTSCVHMYRERSIKSNTL